MKTKTLLAALVGGVAAFIIGFIVFGMLLRSYFLAHRIQYAGIMKDKPNLIVLFIANFIIAWIFALFLQWSNRSGFMKGALVGAIIGGLMLLQFDLFGWSLYNVWTDFTGVIVHVLVNVVFCGIVGGVVGAMMGMGEKEATAA